MWPAFAPAGEVPMTIEAIYGVPSPLRDAGGEYSNFSPREVGTIAPPALTGSSIEAPNVPAGALSRQRSSALVDPSHEAFWLLLLAVGFLGLVHLDVGGSARVRAGRR